MNQELKKIGEKLNLSETDINRIIKANKKKNNKIIYIIITAIISALTFIIGYFWDCRWTCEPCDHTYPYGMNPIFIGFLTAQKKKSKVLALLAGIIMFLTLSKAKLAMGLDVGTSFYNVFTKTN